MGRRASAYLIYGLDFGDENNHYSDDHYLHGYPKWLAQHVPEDERTCSFDISEALDRQFKDAGFQTFVYGYESDSHAFGIEIAWAIDYGSTVVDLAKLNNVQIGEYVSEWLDEHGAPPGTKFEVHLLAEYS